jgi:nitrogen regulatory protein PII
MKTVTAIIRPTKLYDVKDALLNVGVEMMTVTHVMGCGRRKTNGNITLGVEAEENLLNKTRIEIMVDDHLCKKTIGAILMKSRTGFAGDGKIFVMDAPQFMSISTTAAP